MCGVVRQERYIRRASPSPSHFSPPPNRIVLWRAHSDDRVGLLGIPL
jgi:hypothetical protein